MLVEGVAKGDADAPAQATLLRQRYPEISTANLVLGAQAATNSYYRTRLIEQIAEIGEASGLAFLKQEMVEGPERESRVAAAYRLVTQVSSRAIAAIAREWKE